MDRLSNLSSSLRRGASAAPGADPALDRMIFEPTLIGRSAATASRCFAQATQFLAYVVPQELGVFSCLDAGDDTQRLREPAQLADREARAFEALPCCVEHFLAGANKSPGVEVQDADVSLDAGVGSGCLHATALAVPEVLARVGALSRVASA